MAVVINDGMVISVKVDIGEIKNFPVYRFRNIKGSFNVAEKIDGILTALAPILPGVIDDDRGVRATVNTIIIPSI